MIWPMKYRDFGSTGLHVSGIVFGCGAVGGILINADDDTRRAAVRRALDAGINWFDTAASYGQGRSEEALGWLLKEVPEDPYVSTKFSIDTRDLSDIAGQIEQSLEASLVRLQRASVTVLQLHNRLGSETNGRTLSVHDVLRPGGVADGLDRLVEKGLTSHIGMTALGDASSCIEVIGSGRFQSAQVYHNLINPTAARAVASGFQGQRFDGILEACSAAGVAAMNIRVFAAGIIATDERHGRESPLTAGTSVDLDEARTKAVLSAIPEFADQRAAAAIRFALADERLACVIFGLAELDHLETAIGAEADGAMPETSLIALQEVYQHQFENL